MKYLILLLFLVGCGHTPDKEVVPSYIFVPVACEEFNPIAPIRALPVVWVKGISEQGNYVLGLRGDQYANLSINSAETLRYITEQNKAIVYYERCIEDHNSKQNEEGEP
jgi:hypothetical protein